MHNYLKIQKLFGLLDIILAVRFYTHITNISFNMPLEGVLSILTAITVISLFISGIGLLLGKRWSYYLVYFQFPFRLMFFLLTFGFITKINYLFFGDMAAYQALIFIAAILELGRVIVTIFTVRNIKKGII